MNYALSPPGEHFITADESFIAEVRDIGDGHFTGGWGHVDDSLVAGTPVTRAQGIAWFRADVQHVLRALESAATKYCVVLNQAQVDALVSLLFNCGVGLLEATHSLGQAFAGGDVDAIGKSILLYENATINGKHGPWLRGRRQAEYQIFCEAPSVLAGGVLIATAAASTAEQTTQTNS